MNAKMVLKDLANNLRECIAAKKEFDGNLSEGARKSLSFAYQVMCDNLVELENILYDVEICEREFCVEPEVTTLKRSGNVIYLTKKM